MFNKGEEERLSTQEIINERNPNRNIEELKYDGLGGELNLFTYANLKTLCISNQGLTNLNLLGNENLINLDCSYNELQSLNLSKNFQLKFLNCSHNQLTSLSLINQQ